MGKFYVSAGWLMHFGRGRLGLERERHVQQFVQIHQYRIGSSVHTDLRRYGDVHYRIHRLRRSVARKYMSSGNGKQCGHGMVFAIMYSTTFSFLSSVCRVFGHAPGAGARRWYADHRAQGQGMGKSMRHSKSIDEWPSILTTLMFPIDQGAGHGWPASLHHALPRGPRSAESNRLDTRRLVTVLWHRRSKGLGQ